MVTHEPEATALLLATCGLLLGVSVIFSRASQRTGLPIVVDGAQSVGAIPVAAN